MFIPLLSAETGEVLTHQNWMDLGVTTLAYALDELLVKPGMAHLLTQPSLAHYTGWTGHLVLDASRVKPNQAMRSRFDGSFLKASESELETLITHLNVPLVEPSESVTDAPIRAALAGQVASSGGVLSLSELKYRDDHTVMDAACTCSICQAGLTRAYLHHLWTQVPALCIRFLAQHNVNSILRHPDFSL